VTRGSKRGPALPAAELARDPASIQLQELRERLSAHADKLPPDLYDALQKLIVAPELQRRSTTDAGRIDLIAGVMIRRQQAAAPRPLHGEVILLHHVGSAGRRRTSKPHRSILEGVGIVRFPLRDFFTERSCMMLARIPDTSACICDGAG
jgi:hypothetical protein